MTENEQYKLAFSVLHCGVTPSQVRQRAEQTKGGFTLKRKFIPILIGAILVVLLGTAVATELSTHWLSALLTNADTHPELTEKVEDVSASATVDGTTWTVEHLLVEGRVVFWQLTKSRTDGSPVVPFESGDMPELVLLDANGNDLGIGFAITLRRIDDASDPSTCTLLYRADMATPGHSGEEFAGMTLHLAHMKEGEPVEIDGFLQTPHVPAVALETTIKPYPLRETLIADGTGLKVGRLSLELQGIALLGDSFEEAAVMADDGCALVLKGGRELPVQFAVQVSSELPDEEQWQIAALPEIIDPQDAIAFRIGDTQYALQDE